MKLLSKYNRVNMLTTVGVLLLSGICYYFVIRYVLLDQLDDVLKVEEQEIIDYVRTNNRLPNPSIYKDQEVSFVQDVQQSVKRTFYSIKGFSKEENEQVISRRLEFPLQLNGKNHTVIISKSEEETDELIRLIFLLTLGIVILLLAALFIINRFVLNKLWRPFNATLKELKQFNLFNNTKLQLEKTGINEFSDLNEAVSVMSNRVMQDYHALKTFTENASHEMQTPLAIINSKLDVLIQDETISEFQMRQLQDVYDALDRLSNLNQSLLLLTKIGNNQFNEKEAVPLDKVINEKLSQLDELIESRQLHVTAKLHATVIQLNRHLVDALTGNLLINAIGYNREGGEISILLNEAFLRVSNTSLIPALDANKVFQRFYRHEAAKQDGNGLGLSIVKQICDMAGYRATYAFNNGVHEFTIYFMPA